jgi:hypothetical protein
MLRWMLNARPTKVCFNKGQHRPLIPIASCNQLLESELSKIGRRPRRHSKQPLCISSFQVVAVVQAAVVLRSRARDRFGAGRTLGGAMKEKPVIYLYDQTSHRGDTRVSLEFTAGQQWSSLISHPRLEPAAFGPESVRG